MKNRKKERKKEKRKERKKEGKKEKKTANFLFHFLCGKNQSERDTQSRKKGGKLLSLSGVCLKEL